MDQLVTLVKSLQKSEKRYFVLSTGLQKGDKKYLELFHLIDELEHPTEKDFENFFDNKTHFYHHKKYLYQQLVDCLRNYHAQDIGSKCHAFLEELEILNQRLLYNTLYKRIKVAKKFGIQYEQFSFLVQLCQYEQAYTMFQKNKGEDIINIERVSQQYLVQAQNLSAIQLLEKELKVLLKQWRFANTKEQKNLVNQLKQNELLQNPQLLLSQRAFIIYLECKIAIAKLLREDEDLKKYAKQSIQYFEQNPFLIKVDVEMYISKIVSLLTWKLQNAEFDSLPPLFDKIAKYQGISIRVDVFLFLKVTPFQLYYNDKMENDEKMKCFLDTTEKKFKKLQEYIDDQGLVVNYSNFALYHHKYGNFKKTQYFIALALEKCSFKVRRDIFSFMSLFRVLVLYDQKKYENLVEITENIYRKLYRKKMNFELELMVLHFFKKTPFNILSKRELIQNFLCFKDKIKSKLKNKRTGFFYYINIESWINDKIEELEGTG